MAEAAEKKQGMSTGVVVAIILAVGLVLFCAVGGILAALMVPALVKARQRGHETKCANQLKQIGIAAITYADDHKLFPHDPSDPDGYRAMQLLLEKNYIDRPDIFLCPSQGNRVPGPPLQPSTCDYEGFAVPVKYDAKGTTPIAWDREPHPDGTRHVVFVDAHVEKADEARFQELRRKARGE